MAAENRTSAEQQVLALAGVCQCVMLAQELARRGHAQPGPLRCALSSILILNEIDVDIALGGSKGFSPDCRISDGGSQTLQQLKGYGI